MADVIYQSIFFIPGSLSEFNRYKLDIKWRQIGIIKLWSMQLHV